MKMKKSWKTKARKCFFFLYVCVCPGDFANIFYNALGKEHLEGHIEKGI